MISMRAYLAGTSPQKTLREGQPARHATSPLKNYRGTCPPWSLFKISLDSDHHNKSRGSHNPSDHEITWTFLIFVHYFCSMSVQSLKCQEPKYTLAVHANPKKQASLTTFFRFPFFVHHSSIITDHPGYWIRKWDTIYTIY